MDTRMRHLIGLGYRCDVAFQLRMHGRENVAHFFDWLATPLDGVIKIIEADFDVFHPDDLELATTQSPHFVRDQETGVAFFHQFPLFDRNVQPDFLLFHTPFIKKFQHLANRFRTYLASKPVTLVRRDAEPEQALRLEQAVLTRFPNADVRFLYLNARGEAFETPHGRGRPFRDDGSSLGDPAAWAALLLEEGLINEPYRHATAEILGHAHDDHNLSTDNRFSEAQLQAAIAANPHSPAFPLELSRWYDQRGREAEALAMAELAWDRQPMPDARYQLALMQWKFGRRSADQAAADFAAVAAGLPNPPARLLRDTAAALAEAGRHDEALGYANRALAADPLDLSHYLQKIRSLYALKRFAAVERSVSAALRLGPIPNIFHHMRAKALEALGRLEEAVAAEQYAVRDGGEFQSQFNLSGLLTSLGRHREALEVCSRALSVAGPHAAAVHDRIAALTVELGRHAAAA